MTDMQKLFTEHVKIDGPPLANDVDSLAAAGRRRLRGRRLGAVGGFGAMAAIVVAVAVTLSGGAPPTGLGAANDPGAGYSLPDDLPGAPKDYDWGYTGDDDGNMQYSEAADHYGDAYTEWFATNGDDEIKDWPGMAVKHRALFRNDDGGEQVSEEYPYYGIVAVAALDAVNYGTDKDYVGLRVYPPGNFKEGAGDTYEYLYSCTDGAETDRGRPAEYDRTCDEVPEQGYVTVETVTTEDGKKTSVENLVILFRADGSAVEVTSRVYDQRDGAEPKLGFDELLDLAKSMPDDAVTDKE